MSNNFYNLMKSNKSTDLKRRRQDWEAEREKEKELDSKSALKAIDRKYISLKEKEQKILASSKKKQTRRNERKTNPEISFQRVSH